MAIAIRAAETTIAAGRRWCASQAIRPAVTEPAIT
jgi:hypothetical protein